MAVSHLPLLLAAAPATLASPQSAEAVLHRIHADHVLGTSFDAVVFGADAATAERAFGAMQAEIDRLDGVLSGWRADSELSALNASDAPVRVSPDLFRVIDAAETWRAACPAGFSGRLGRVEAMWRRAEATAPDPVELQAVAGASAEATVGLDRAALTIYRSEPVVFATDALAKGYIIDRAMAAARAAAPEAKGLLVDIGGDLRCWGAGPHGAWTIGVASAGEADNVAPDLAIRIGDRAVATSGAGARDRRIEGRAFSHILSPTTGQAVEAPTVAVVADTAMEADALATALAVLPPKDGLALAAARGADARIIGADGVQHATPGWQDLVYRPLATDVFRIPTAAAVAGWPAGYAARIDFTILQGEGGRRVREPYVVIWITDAQGQLVRTLAHYGVKGRYVSENFIWWRSFSATQNYDLLASVTRPSRAAGSYSLTWDGRNDQGQPLPRGRYTIHVESSREHGPHAHQAVALDLGAAPAAGSAAPDAELGPMAVRYGAGL